MPRSELTLDFTLPTGQSFRLFSIRSRLSPTVVGGLKIACISQDSASLLQNAMAFQSGGTSMGNLTYSMKTAPGHRANTRDIRDGIAYADGGNRESTNIQESYAIDWYRFILLHPLPSPS